MIAYYATLGMLCYGAYFPSGRVWGFNWWAYYPVWVPIGLLVTGSVLPFAIRKSLHHQDTAEEPSSNRSYWLGAGIIAFTFILSFITLYSRTHFLGDGYTLISLLSVDQPLIKYREIGESLLHIWARDLFGGATESATVLSYRVISACSGVLFVAATIWASWRLFDSNLRRIFFVLGMLSGGYMLLFFGYVENYSLLVLSVGIYTYLGLLITQGRIRRRWILLPQAMAIFFHIFGVILVPATIHILTRQSRINRIWRSRSGSRRWLLIVMAGIAVVTAFIMALNKSLFFQIAVLGFVPHRFTIAGYTLFSPEHLIDFVNLIFLLCPGLVVLLVGLRRSDLREFRRNANHVFLLTAAICGLAAAFIFDPKLGMPRDWDLFAFAGLPVAALTMFYSLQSSRQHLHRAVLAIVLGLLVLGPRVASQVSEKIAIAHVYNYKDLDQLKNRNLYSSLIQYLKERGMPAESDGLYSEWNRRFPDRLQSNSLPQMLARGQYREAKALSANLLTRNPLLHDVWNNLGLAYAYLGNHDSAITCYETALALNPGNASAITNIAASLVFKGELDRADRLLDEAIAIDSNAATHFYQKARIAQMRRDRSAFLLNLEKAASKNDAQPAMIVDLMKFETERGNLVRARQLLNSALEHGLDSAYIDSFIAKYPALVDPAAPSR